jgi:type II secretory pathway pseudopilin PulG
MLRFMSRTSRYFPRCLQHMRGVSALELTVVLCVTGLLITSLSTSMEHAQFSKQTSVAQAHAQLLQLRLRQFASEYGRLPCPDLDGQGWESLSQAQCRDRSEFAWMPYRSLGLDLPEPSLRAHYGVYRNSSAQAGNADLTLSMERTGDLIGTPNYIRRGDLMAALSFLIKENKSTAHLFVTGDSKKLGPNNCASFVLNHPAFVILIPQQDSNQDGQRLDGAHGQRCIHAPSTEKSTDYDDVVVVESAPQLLAWLGKQP